MRKKILWAITRYLWKCFSFLYFLPFFCLFSENNAGDQKMLDTIGWNKCIENMQCTSNEERRPQIKCNKKVQNNLHEGRILTLVVVNRLCTNRNREIPKDLWSVRSPRSSWLILMKFVPLWDIYEMRRDARIFAKIQQLHKRPWKSAI